ncbi:hypothetical protein [Calothrix sp. PCC 6303]|uniref:hypothetical protein n=1 Tax=Calothrix sp. PCC 6303 TaxID=1170562 RepID=UPI00030A26D3|nr:hypothetical protein [Calothrix sp. PCC 6303]
MGSNANSSRTYATPKNEMSLRSVPKAFQFDIAWSKVVLPVPLSPKTKKRTTYVAQASLIVFRV